MTEKEQEAKLMHEKDLLFARFEQAKIKGIMPCEYTHCQCPIKSIIGYRTMSVIAFPDLHIEAVCLTGIQDWAARTNTNLHDL